MTRKQCLCYPPYADRQCGDQFVSHTIGGFQKSIEPFCGPMITSFGAINVHPNKDNCCGIEWRDNPVLFLLQRREVISSHLNECPDCMACVK